jgi:hypothetical protein
MNGQPFKKTKNKKNIYPNVTVMSISTAKTDKNAHSASACGSGHCY